MSTNYKHNQYSLTSYVNFFLINLILFFQPSRSLIQDETLFNFLFTFGYIFILIVIQILLINFISVKFKLIKLKNLIISLCLVANFVCIFLHVSDLYNGLILAEKLLIIFPLILFFYIFYSLINSSLNLKIIFRNMFVAIIFLQFYQGYQFFLENKLQREATLKSYSHYSNEINFVKKPKIFIFVMDALTPKEIVKEKLDYNPAYSEFLDANFDNFEFVMSDFASTLSFLNSLLYLDSDLWLKDKNKNDLFNGIYSSPVFEIFKKNGYKISTYSGASQLNAKSNYIDFNYFNNLDKQTFDFDRPNYCNWIGSAFFMRYYGICYFYKFFSNKYHLGNPSLDFISKKKDDWLTISYFTYPAHVHVKINDEASLKNYRKLFVKKSEIAKNILSESYNIIKKNTDDFIILVFGDHGLMTSGPNKFPETDNIYETIKDLYVVSAYRKDDNKICESYFNNSNLDSPPLIMRSLINCLSNKNDIFFTHPDKNKFFTTVGYDKDRMEIFETKYFNRQKFIEKFKKD